MPIAGERQGRRPRPTVRCAENEFIWNHFRDKHQDMSRKGASNMIYVLGKSMRSIAE